MDELGEALNRILSDPQQMAAVQNLASELLGGGAGGTAGTAGAAKAPPNLAGLLAGLGGGGGGKAELVQALSPWLKPERAAKLRRAQRLASALRLAGAAWQKLGGEDGV